MRRLTTALSPHPRSARRRRVAAVAVPTLVALAGLGPVAAHAAAGRAAAVAAPAGVQTPAPAGGALQRIAGNVLPSLAQLASTPAAPTTVLSLGVALTHPDPAGEDALQAALYTPGSPRYHQFPTVDALAAQFGVPASRTADVVARLRAAGVSVDSVDPLGDYVAAHGTVAAVDRAFGVTERVYRTAAGLSFVANAQGPLLPRLDGVSTVVGLNTLQHFTRPADVSHRSTVGARPAQDTCVRTVCTGNTTPKDLWATYDQPATHTGTGVRVAIIGEGNPTNILGYLRKFEAGYGLRSVPTLVHCVQGGSCGTDTSGDGEWQIDTQASTGMAPGLAREELYFAKSILDPDLNNAFVAWATDRTGPLLASASLGECEASPANGVFTGVLNPLNANTSSGPTAVVAFGNGEASAVDPVLKTAVLLGKTLFASTGDTGSSCPVVGLPVIGAGNGVANQGVPEQNYPAVSPNVVAVGGTVLYTTNTGEGAQPSYTASKPGGTRTAETAWTFGGGGASLYQPAPSWQHTISAIIQPCVLSADGSAAATGTLCRGVPDVAAQSGDVATNGYSVYGSGGWTSGGGTSLSSPLWVGMWARVQGAAPHNLGFAAPALYRVGANATSYARDFYDVTVGANGLHAAAPGWDYTTGFGAPQVAGLIADLVPAAATRPTTTSSAPVTATVSTVSRATGSTATGALATTGGDLGLAGTLAALLLAAAGGTVALRRRA